MDNTKNTDIQIQLGISTVFVFRIHAYYLFTIYGRRLRVYRKKYQRSFRLTFDSYTHSPKPTIPCYYNVKIPSRVFQISNVQS